MFRCAFTIRSDTRYLAILRQWVAAAARLAGDGEFPRRAVIPCTLALIEAVDNAIFHAHRGREDLPIRLSLSAARKVVTIEVGDCGRGIGRRVRGLPDVGASGGRGLFLIHRLMSRVESRMRGRRHSLRMVHGR